jgi:cytochrome P450
VKGPWQSESHPLSLWRRLVECRPGQLRIVGEALLCTDMREEFQAVAGSFNTLNEQTVERFRALRLLPPILPTADDRTFGEARRSLYEVVARLIPQRRQRLEDHGGLLSMFMLAKDEEPDETTANMLSWAWVLPHQNPDAECKPHTGLEEVLGGRLPTAEDLPKRVSTRRVLDETPRLSLRGGVSLYLSPSATHRLPELWPEPVRFEPDRFTPEQVAARPRYAYLPFLGGPRQCIGNNFALMEGTLILATLAQRHRPRRVEGYTPTPEPRLTPRPRGELPVTLSAR